MFYLFCYGIYFRFLVTNNFRIGIGIRYFCYRTRQSALHSPSPPSSVLSLPPIIPEPRPLLTLDQIDKLFPIMTYKEWKSSSPDTLKSADQKTPGKGASHQSAPRVEKADDRYADSRGTNDRRAIDCPAPFNYKSQHSLRPSPAIPGTNCAICLDIFKEKDTVRGLPCNHCYHRKCIDPWLTDRRGSCPLCKRNYVPSLEDIQPSQAYGVRQSMALPSLPAPSHIGREVRPSPAPRIQNRVRRLLFGGRGGGISQVDLNELERGET